MVFAHDTAVALQSAVTLVNSALEPVTLTSPDELDEFLSDFGYTGRHDGDQAEVDAIRAVLPQPDIVRAAKIAKLAIKACVCLNRMVIYQGAIVILLSPYII